MNEETREIIESLIKEGLAEDLIIYLYEDDPNYFNIVVERLER